nr:immunoglobulin heavy chain junction region [Macaca mulatta]
CVRHGRLAAFGDDWYFDIW